MPAIEEPHCLRHRPGLIDINPDLAFRPDRASQSLEHLFFSSLVDPGLDVIGLVASFEAVMNKPRY